MIGDNKIEWIDHGPYWELRAPQGEDLWLEGRKGRTTTTASSGMGNKSKFKTAEEQGKIIAGFVQENFTEEELKRMNHGSVTETIADPRSDTVTKPPPKCTGPSPHESGIISAWPRHPTRPRTAGYMPSSAGWCPPRRRRKKWTNT